MLAWLGEDLVQDCLQPGVASRCLHHTGTAMGRISNCLLYKKASPFGEVNLTGIQSPVYVILALQKLMIWGHTWAGLPPCRACCILNCLGSSEARHMVSGSESLRGLPLSSTKPPGLPLTWTAAGKKSESLVGLGYCPQLLNEKYSSPAVSGQFLCLLQGPGLFAGRRGLQKF